MANKDLHDFLALVEEKGQLVRVRKEISPEYEISALSKKVMDQHGPALLFEHIKGHPDWQLVCNLTGTKPRAALIFDAPVERTAEVYMERLANLTPCKQVTSQEAPVKERMFLGDKVDLEEIPILNHFAGEPAFITLGIVIARDPDSGLYNWSVHRLQRKGKNKLGILISPYQLWMIQQKAERKGQPLEVAVSIGNHPLDVVAAISMVPFEVEEPELAGALRGEPLEVVKAETVDLEVPARAEAIIEGRVPAGVLEEEGPFGEFSGYYAQPGLRPIIEVSGITRRKKPIYLGHLEGGTIMSRNMAAFGREGPILEACRRVSPKVRAVSCCTPVVGWCVISMKKEREGEQKNVMAAAISVDAYIKQCMVVDEDVDVFNPVEALWAFSFRVNPERDITIIPGMWLSPLDPTSNQGTSAKVLIDATVPLAEDASRFKRVEIPAEVNERIRIEDYLP